MRTDPHRSEPELRRRMGVWLKRRLDSGKLEQAEWRLVNAEMGDMRIDIGCPCCGETSVLDVGVHEIARSGVVSPIWLCPNIACPAADFLLLDGYP